MLEACICSTDPEKKVTAVTLLTIVLHLSLVFCLKSLKLSSTIISWIIWNLILFPQIMDFDALGLLVTYSPISLFYDLLPLGMTLDISNAFFLSYLSLNFFLL